eukprot:99945_1
MAAFNHDYGSIESFVLSSNRRQLLNIQSNDQVETKFNEGTKIPMNEHEHTYYHLLQIENEITSILIQYKNNINDLMELSDSDKNKIKSLLNEAQNIILKYKSDDNNNNVSITKFRH